MRGVNFKYWLILLIICVGCETQSTKKSEKEVESEKLNTNVLETDRFVVDFQVSYNKVDSEDSLYTGYMVKSDSLEIVLTEMNLEDGLTIQDTSEMTSTMRSIRQKFENVFGNVLWIEDYHKTIDSLHFEGILKGKTTQNKHIYCRVDFRINFLLNLTILCDSSLIRKAEATFNSLSFK